MLIPKERWLNGWMDIISFYTCLSVFQSYQAELWMIVKTVYPFTVGKNAASSWIQALGC